MVREGGKQAKLTLTRGCWFGALPTLPDGAERSLTGTVNSTLQACRFRDVPLPTAVLLSLWRAAYVGYRSSSLAA